MIENKFYIHNKIPYVVTKTYIDKEIQVEVKTDEGVEFETEIEPFLISISGTVPSGATEITEAEYEEAASSHIAAQEKSVEAELKKRADAGAADAEILDAGLQKFADEALEIGFSLDAIGALTGKTAKKKEKR